MFDHVHFLQKENFYFFTLFSLPMKVLVGLMRTGNLLESKNSIFKRFARKERQLSRQPDLFLCKRGVTLQACCKFV
jgi:hypothetical protein